MSDLLGQDFSDSPVSIELSARACRKEATCVSHTPCCVFSIQFVYSPGITRHNSVKLDSRLDVLMFGLGGDFSIHETGFWCSGRINTSPGEPRQWKYFCKRCQSSSSHKRLVLCERISKLKFTCPYPPKPTPSVGTLSRLQGHIPTRTADVSQPGRVCATKGRFDKCGKSLKRARLAHRLWKRRWGQPRQAWHLETTLIKSNFLILQGRETRSDSLLATVLQF